MDEQGVIGKGLPVVIWIHGGGFSSGSSLPQGPTEDSGWTPDPREFASYGQVNPIKSNLGLLV